MRSASTRTKLGGAGLRATAPPKRPNTGLMGAAVFIVAESAFFSGLFIAYFFLLSSTPLPAVRVHQSLAVPVMNTFVLALSVVATIWSERGIAHNDQRRLIIGLAVAAALGLAFMAVQSLEFAALIQQGLTPNGTPYGSSFFALLVFHVLRVFAGVCFMVIVLIRGLLGQFSERRRAAVQACALYWYFIATVWILVLLTLYVL